MQTLIIGAGITGLSAARRLLELGLSAEHIRIVDKSRGAGGRMASRRLQTPSGTARLDHGAQFFTARSKEFKALLSNAQDSGAIKRWPQGLSTNNQCHTRWYGSSGMTDLCKWIAADSRLKVEFKTPVMHLGEYLDANSFNAVIHTAPVPQALATLNGSGRLPAPDIARRLASVQYHATLTVMLATTQHPTGLPSTGALQLTDHPDLAFITDNHAKGISTEPAVTIHLTHTRSELLWSASDQEVASFAMTAAAEHLGSAKDPSGISASSVQRWRYAEPVNCLSEGFVMWGDQPRIVLAGEAFCGPRVEGGYLSGRAAADALMAEV